jgi:hypothetical protein
MNEEEKGWRAFPMVFEKIVGEGMKEINIQKGITIRDYFAAKAMQGMLAENGGGASSNADLAVFAYRIADEMMKARKL